MHVLEARTSNARRACQVIMKFAMIVVKHKFSSSASGVTFRLRCVTFHLKRSYVERFILNEMTKLKPTTSKFCAKSL